MRAYAGLIAIEIPAGQHILSLEFAPLSYTIGALDQSAHLACFGASRPRDMFGGDNA